MNYLLLAFSGLVGGFSAGLIGIGGGLIYVFLLTPALQNLGITDLELPQFIVANSLFCVFFASGSAVISLHKKGETYWKESLLVLIGSSIMSIIAFRYIVQTTWFSYQSFNILLVIILFYMLYATTKNLTATKANNTSTKQIKKGYLLGAGIGGGLIASLSGLGGGVVMIPILNGFLKIDMKKVRSISLTVICFTTLGLTLYNLFQPVNFSFKTPSKGLIIFPISISVVIGGIIGSLLGVKVSSRLKPSTITKIYLAFLCLFIAKKILEIHTSNG